MSGGGPPAARPEEGNVRIASLGLAALAAGLLVLPARAPAHAEAGQPVEPQELPALGGGRVPLLGKGALDVLVFFRPGNERSADTLERLAECEPALAAKQVRVVGVVSSSVPADEVRAAVARAGLKAPVLVDEGDALYGRLELRQHPVVVLVDRRHRVAAVEPYQRLRYCELVKARVAFLLGEITQAELDRILAPPKAEFPTAVAGGSAGRYVKLGQRELEKGNCALAVKAFDHALESDPKNPLALAGKASCAARPPAAPAKP